MNTAAYTLLGMLLLAMGTSAKVFHIKADAYGTDDASTDTSSTTAGLGETSTTDSGETTTVDSGETTTADSGETTTAGSGETTTAGPEETTTAASGETTTAGSGAASLIPSLAIILSIVRYL